MEEILIILAIIFLLSGFITIIASSIVSSRTSRKEEQYRNLDPKDLDDEIKWQDTLVYDDEFVRKEK